MSSIVVMADFNIFSLPDCVYSLVVPSEGNQSPDMPTITFFYWALLRRVSKCLVHVKIPVLAIWAFHIYSPSIIYLHTTRMSLVFINIPYVSATCTIYGSIAFSIQFTFYHIFNYGAEFKREPFFEQSKGSFLWPPIFVHTPIE